MKKRRFLPYGLVAGLALGAVVAALQGSDAWHVVFVGLVLGGIADLVRFLIVNDRPTRNPADSYGGDGGSTPFLYGDSHHGSHDGGSHGGFDGGGGSDGGGGDGGGGGGGD